MKFLFVMMLIRYIVILLTKLTEKEKQTETNEEVEEKAYHPAEFGLRYDEQRSIDDSWF